MGRSFADKRKLAFATTDSVTVIVVFQFQRFDFGSVFTTSDFSVIESDSLEFVMVNSS